jgi:hypothetical protein
MKKIKIVMATFITLSLVFAASAFTLVKKTPEKRPSLYFYRYTSDDLSESAIKERTNYAFSTNSCDGEDHVCGVYLESNTQPGLGDPPPVSAFNGVSGDLWTSEDQGFSELPGTIIMKD